MRQPLIVACILVTAAAILRTPAARGAAYVDASAHSWNYPPGEDVTDEHTGTFGPVTATASGSNGTGSASAAVSITTIAGTEDIGLHAQAQGSASGDASTEVTLPGGSATAEWHDNLHASNDDLNPVIFRDKYFTFTPALRGTATGSAGGSLSVTLAGETKGVSGGGQLRFTLPATAFGLTDDGQPVNPFPGIELDMVLTDVANAADAGDSASADYSHTATLNVYISDANGNPLANPPAVSLVGDSGSYDLTPPVPEPAGAAMAACAALVVLSRRRRTA